MRWSACSWHRRHVYRQLAGSTGIFAVLAFLLWSFHPAFRMGGAP